MDLNRRTVMAGLAAASLASSISAKPSSLEASTPQGRFRIFALMRAALDEQLCTSWMKAQYFAVVEDRMEPLFGVISAVFARYRQHESGGLEAVSAEIAWFTDTVTGKVLDEFANPWTGKSVKVPEGGLSPSRYTIGADLSLKLGRAVPGMEMVHEVPSIEARGQDVWMTERMRSSVTIPGKPRPFRYSENNILHASRKALSAKGATRVTSDVGFTNVCSWRPWLEMGDHPGHMTASGMGKQNTTPDTLPSAWIETTNARRPGLLDDPAKLLAPLWDMRG